MRLLQLLFIFCFTCISCGKSHSSNQDTANLKIIRVMTYNIHHGAPPNGATNDIRLEDIAAVINKQNPDLVALQEVDSMTKRAPLDEAKKLGELTGMHYYFSKAINYENGSYGDAILSKYPIINKHTTPLPMPDPSGEARSVGIITVKLPSGENINFATTHLDIVSNREAQVEALNGLSKNNEYPLILAGDFNAFPTSTYITTLKKEFTFLCSTNCPLTAPSDNPSKTIDYIILNPDAAALFHALSYNVVNGIYSSDHLPLITYLTLK